MITDQQHHRAELRQIEDTRCKFTLKRRIGLPIFESVACEHGHINIMVERIDDHFFHSMQKVEHARAHSAFGVWPTIVFHAEVNIGKMQHADHYCGNLILANSSGLTQISLTAISQWMCGTVLRPVLPLNPITSPCSTN